MARGLRDGWTLLLALGVGVPIAVVLAENLLAGGF
jgi:hypothetical protein